VTYHDNLDRTLRQHLSQPVEPGAYFRRKIPLQDALPGKEEHVVMSITEQARATGFHDTYRLSQDLLELAFSIFHRWCVVQAT
jgi:hypothetical protein